MNGIKKFQNHSAQKSKKNGDKSNSIVVSSVVVQMEKYLDYYNNSNNSRTRKKQKSAFSVEVYLISLHQDWIPTMDYYHILSSNLTMWDWSLCPRRLQDHEFSGEQNDKLYSFNSRTSSLIKASKWISCQEYQYQWNVKIGKSAFNFFWDLSWKRKKKGV